MPSRSFSGSQVTAHPKPLALPEVGIGSSGTWFLGSFLDELRDLLSRQKFENVTPAHKLESAHSFFLAFDLYKGLCILINWLINFIALCHKEITEIIDEIIGAISFGNDTSDGSRSNDLGTGGPFEGVVASTLLHNGRSFRSACIWNFLTGKLASLS